MKIVVLDGFALCANELHFDALEALGEVSFYERTRPQEAAGRIGQAEIVLTNKVPITEEIMEECPNLRYIGVTATGYNIVDLEAASRRGIIVVNAPAYSTQAVAQHVFALLLESVSRTADYDGRVKAGTWAASPDFCFFAAPMEELCGKTMGILGYGHIGQTVARIAQAFGMEVIVCTPHPKGKEVRFVDQQTLFEKSDVISLHCPLTEKTRGSIGRQALAQMRQGVRIINTARGPLVDEPAMAEALKAGRVAYYMADVLTQEPPKADQPLLSAPNTIITPHVAWAPLQTRERLLKIVTENVRAFVNGHPVNVVNEEGRR